MHQNDKENTPADLPTKRAEIAIRFNVPKEQATEDYLNAIVGSIRRELKGYEDFANTTTEVAGKWL